MQIVLPNLALHQRARWGSKAHLRKVYGSRIARNVVGDPRLPERQRRKRLSKNLIRAELSSTFRISGGET